MNYKYIIFDTFDGAVYGTNNGETARDLARSEDYFVVNTELNPRMKPEEHTPVKEWDNSHAT